MSPFLDLMIRMTIDISATWVIALGLFYRYSKKKALVFCLFMFNMLIFIVGYLLSNTSLGLGAGLGLFAIFTMLRYRSETLNLREMTYLFIIITIGFINSTRGLDKYVTLIVLNLVIVILVYYLEKYIGSKILTPEKLKYNNLKLLKPQFRHLLYQDIYCKTGIKAKSVDIESISLTDKTATLTVYFDEKEYKQNMESLMNTDNEDPMNQEIDDEQSEKETKKGKTVLRVIN